MCDSIDTTKIAEKIKEMEINIAESNQILATDESHFLALA
jgi:hypothetical protein